MDDADRSTKGREKSWFLGGLWHGASWNFVLWGLFHGVALAFHKMWMMLTGRQKGEKSHGLSRAFGVLITFHFVCFCWIFFRNANFDNSVDMLRQIFTAFRPQLLVQLVEAFGVLITFHFVCFCWIFFRNANFDNSVDMLRQIFTAFRPQLLVQLVEGYWKVFALMLLGYLLHFAPRKWEDALCREVIGMPFLCKALVLVTLIYVVIQMKSTEIQPFIYFQF